MNKPILKQTYWNFVLSVVTVVLGFGSVIGWGVSVEIRMSQNASFNTIQDSIDTLVGRTQNIEKLLLPVIVDYKVRKEIEEKMSKILPPIPFPTPPILLEKPVIKSPTKVPTIAPSYVEPNVQQTPEMIDKAKKWAEEKIQEGQPKKPKPDLIKIFE
jgi:hypothetical protein